MGEFKANRKEAWKLLNEYVKEESLIRHSLLVESAMRHFAELYDEDIEKWGVVGLLHDLDFEKYPDEHCVKVEEILEEEGYPKEYIRAITSHGYGVCEGVTNKPEHIMEKVLFTVDQLTGLINACILVRPSKSILDLKPKSVTKKIKDKNFAAAIDRDTINKGVEMLQMERADVIQETIDGLKKDAEALEIKGNL